MHIKKQSIFIGSGVAVALAVGAVAASLWALKKEVKNNFPPCRYVTNSQGQVAWVCVSSRDTFQPSMIQLAQLTVDHQQLPIQVGPHHLIVEVVNSPASITQGLSDRTEIGSDGMLFVFGEKRMPQFWMKNMHFDLDLVWISDDKVLAITAGVPRPQPNMPLANLPRYQPPDVVEAVLEIPAGKAKELGIKPGDTVASLP